MENEIINDLTPVQQQETNASEQTPVTQQKPQKSKETVGFWEFFGLIALFSLPVIGFIALIVFMFSPKRKSIKNYARAMMTWLVVRIVAAVLIISLVITAVGNLILPAISQSLGVEFDSIFEVAELVIDITNRNYSSTLEYLQPQLIEILGEEYAPLLAELSNSEYNDLLRQIVDRDYATILSDLEANKYPNLASSIGDEKYADLIKEVQMASNGESSALLDQINSIIPTF